MKKIFRIRKQNGTYDAFYGDKFEGIHNDNSLLPSGYEYEMDDNTQLGLLWLTFYDYDGILPMTMFDLNPGELKVSGNMVRSKKLDDETISIHDIYDKNSNFKINVQNFKEIWEKYKSLKCQKIDEIILERDGDHFSIRGVWFDKEQNEKTNQ